MSVLAITVCVTSYDRYGSPLAAEQIFEDIAEDYRKRTVTIDPYDSRKKDVALLL